MYVFSFVLGVDKYSFVTERVSRPYKLYNYYIIFFPIMYKNCYLNNVFRQSIRNKELYNYKLYTKT